MAEQCSSCATSCWFECRPHLYATKSLLKMAKVSRSFLVCWCGRSCPQVLLYQVALGRFPSPGLSNTCLPVKSC